MVRRPIRSTKTPVPGVKEASCASSIGPPGYPRGVGEDRHTGLQGAHTAIPLLREGESQEVTTEARTRRTTVPDQWFTAEEDGQIRPVPAWGQSSGEVFRDTVWTLPRTRSARLAEDSTKVSPPVIGSWSWEF